MLVAAQCLTESQTTSCLKRKVVDVSYSPVRLPQFIEQLFRNWLKDVSCQLSFVLRVRKIIQTGFKMILNVEINGLR